MIDFVAQGFNELLASSGWELAAVILAVAYLLLAMKQSQWCWPAAFISTAIYTVLFWESALLMESVLNAYYLLMAVYGWWAWHQKSDVSQERQIVSWQLSTHIKVIMALSLVSTAVGFLMATYTHADYAYLDAATTVFAIFTTWMVTQKVLENWLYWLVIDGVSVYLYIAKSFNLTALLFIFYCIMVLVGYAAWKKSFLQQNEVV